MSLRSVVVRELAWALLLGPPDAASAAARCARVMERNPAWLPPLTRHLLARFGGAWHAGSHADVAAAILDYPGFVHAWRGARKPRLRQPVLTPLAMGAASGHGDWALPDLPTTESLARWLGLSGGQLEWLAQYGFRPEKSAGSAPGQALGHYACRWIGKRSGGHRLLEVPKPRLRGIQRRILHELLEYVPPHEAAHGFRRGHSCLGNAQVHVGREVVIRLDLRDFFLHVRGARVAGLFRSLGYPEQAARLLAGLCTRRADPGDMTWRDGCEAPPHLDWETRKRYREAHLPQGAPTSPTLANLCAFNLDLRLQGLAEHLGGSYTRYADDLTFSGGRELAGAAQRMVPLVGAIALEEGFALNHRKTRVMRAGTRQWVTGIVVNRRPNVVRADFDALKATLHNCVRHGPASQNREGHEDYRAHLLGRIAHVARIHREKGERLLRLFRRIDWR